PALPWLVALWIGGGLLLSGRLGHGWLAPRGLPATGTRLPPAALGAVLRQPAARRPGGGPGTPLRNVVVGGSARLGVAAAGHPGTIERADRIDAAAAGSPARA